MICLMFVNPRTLIDFGWVWEFHKAPLDVRGVKCVFLQDSTVTRKKVKDKHHDWRQMARCRPGSVPPLLKILNEVGINGLADRICPSSPRSRIWAQRDLTRNFYR